jgi:predicted kinase
MNDKPNLYMTIGLSGSGKSTIARGAKNAITLSSDLIRKELFDDINYQGNNEKVFNTLHKRLKEYLLDGKNVVYDATNLSYKRRRHLLQHHLRGVDFTATAWVIATTPSKCIKNDAMRPRTVGRDVILKQLKSFQFPLYQEGFDNIKVMMTSQNYALNTEFLPSLKSLDNYNQDNENHRYTLGEHLKKTSWYLLRLYDDKHYLEAAGRLHDIGKPIVKTFKNKRGKIDKNAHYYNHQNVSAYLAMFYMPSFIRDLTHREENLVYQLITWHMQCYFIEKEKTKQKYLKFLGEEFYSDLVKLHKADKFAH